MKVALDAQLTIGTATGIGEYVNGLLAHLGAAGIEPVALRAGSLDPWRFDRRVAWDQGFLPLAAARSGARLLHCTAGTMPLLSTLPIVVTVHDLAWLRAQQHAPPYARTYFGGFTAARWRKARAVIVDSSFTRDELLNATALTERNVHVIFPGVDERFARIERAPELDKPFVLAVGTVERRKNVAVAIEALVGVPHARLICLGPPTPYQDECLALARRLGVADRLEFAGYVSRDALMDLYARAAVAVAPSRYEGFGYAAAQALCAGVPLVAARSSSLCEVVGDAAPLLDPDDVAAWRETLASTLRDWPAAAARANTVRSQAIARFSWPSCALATAAAYRSCLT